jgi:AraC-like DNA-binding protein
MNTSAGSGDMIAERTAWWIDGIAGSRQQREAPPATVRFWQPTPERSQELSCAYLNGVRATPHVHEEWQFAVAAEPSTITLGAFRRYSAYADDVTVVHPYDVHTEGGVSGGPRSWLLLHVATDVVERLYQDGAGGVPRFDCPVVKDPRSSRVLADLLQCSMRGSLGGSDFTDGVLEWLSQLLRHHAVGTTAPRSAGGRGGPVERARTYLQAHPTEPLELADLAGFAGVTTSHLVRSFSRSVGLPPKSYQTQIRLARARRLLAQGRPGTWVAYECGFADQSHLSRRFKEFYGLTPGVFQRHFQGQRASEGSIKAA